MKSWNMTSQRSMIVSLIFGVVVTFGFILSPIHQGFASENTIQNDQGWVRVKVLNLRSQASLESAIIGKLHYEQVVDVIENSGSWMKVQNGKTVGWVYSPFIRVMYTAWVVPNQTEVYQELSRDSGPVMSVQQNDQVTVMDEKNGWAYIQKDNKKGWIYAGYLRKTEQPGAWVDASVLNVREKPALDAPVVGQLTRGEDVYIKQQLQDWAMVDVPGGRGGWVAMPYLSKTQIQKPNPRENTQYSEARLQSEREKYLEKNSRLPERFKSAIQRGEFRIGMNKQQVLVSAGEPSKIVTKQQNEDDDSLLAKEWWIYTRSGHSIYLYFQHDYVIAWGQGTPSIAMESNSK